MAGDYTKFSFKPENNYSGVYKQQGRVSLDSDWNEQSEIDDRRWRSETIDIIGECVVPSSTSDGFRVIPTEVVGNFNIGIGRAYVDGIQVECHGLDPQDYDPVLGEEQGTEPVPYTNQPYFPDAPDLTPTSGRRDLIYLDVWQREVTVIEDPGLKEIALGGPDTTTRIQTAWQVKAITDVGDNVSCLDVDQIQRWYELTLPSGGRLTTSTQAPPPDDNLCKISAAGGYRGRENRLYRVEIHTPGQLGTAQFKWSRNNASVVATVTAINTNQITVESLGRDEILRFNVGDWVEVTDDHREYKGLSGYMVQITEINEANRIITVDVDDSDLNSYGFDATVGSRHTRVRRWDQSEEMEPDGLLTVPDDPTDMVDIEDGIRVSFDLDPTDGEFKIGDYWVFYARTADGSVEPLESAPPRGIKHHYCRLALVTWGEEGELTDRGVDNCRIFWPPVGQKVGKEGCCTAVVHPEEDIQAALDSLDPVTGGCVCLKTGTHRITAPIRIEKSNVVLHGESQGTRVERDNGVNLVHIAPIEGNNQITDVVVEGIRFEVLGSLEANQESNILVCLNSCINTSIKNCGLAVASVPDYPGGSRIPVVQAIAVDVKKSRYINIIGNNMDLEVFGVQAEGSTDLHVAENTITGGVFREADDKIPLGFTGIWIGEKVGHTCRVERNRIRNYWVGVSLGDKAERSIITGNEIIRPSLGWQGDIKLYAIDVKAPNCFIIQNYIDLFCPMYGGIKVTGEHTCIKDNKLQAKLLTQGKRPLGIFVGPLELSGLPPDHVVIRNNTLMGPLDGILVTGAEGVTVARNHLEGLPKQGNPRLGIVVTSTPENLLPKNNTIHNNKILDAESGIVLGFGRGNRVINNSVRNGGYGIVALAETNLEVHENVVENMRATGLGGIGLFGTMTVTHNRFASCAYKGLPQTIAPAVGIFFSFADISVESCEVVNTGILKSDMRVVAANPAYGIIAVFVPSCRISNNRISYTSLSLLKLDLDLDKEDRALLLVGPPSHAVYGDEQKRHAFGSAKVTGNFFHGPGCSHLVEFQKINDSPDSDSRFEKLIFNNNNCEHLTKSEEGQQNRATVSFWGSHLIVMGNHVKATVSSLPSMNFNYIKEVAVMGNVTTGDLINLGNYIPTPQENFNVKI